MRLIIFFVLILAIQITQSTYIKEVEVEEVKVEEKVNNIITLNNNNYVNTTNVNYVKLSSLENLYFKHNHNITCIGESCKYLINTHLITCNLNNNICNFHQETMLDFKLEHDIKCSKIEIEDYIIKDSCKLYVNVISCHLVLPLVYLGVFICISCSMMLIGLIQDQHTSGYDSF
jgi:hypothetical protein